MSRYTPAKLALFVVDPKTGAEEKLCPIIFLHGLTGWKEMWGEMPQEVANTTRRKAYVVDQRNHGEAEWTDNFNIDMLTDDLLHFMNTNNLGKVILIGISMGGTVAIDFALSNPDKVEAIFVLDMIVGKYPASLIEVIKSGMNTAHNLLKQIPTETDEEHAMKILSEELQKIMPKELCGKLREQMTGAYMNFLKRDDNGQWSGKANFPALMKALDDPDSLISDPEGTYRGSATFIYGTRSILDLPANEARIKQHFPGAKMVPIEGSSHNILVDCPEKLTQTLLELLLEL